MKTAVYGNFIAISFLALAACKGGGGGSNKTADIPVQPAIITAYANANIYCEVGASTLTCFNKLLNQNGQLCTTEIRTFTDPATMCTQIEFLRLNNTCDTRSALIEVSRQRCQGIQATPPVNSGRPYPQPPPINPPINNGFPNRPPVMGDNYKNVNCSLTGHNGRVPLSGTAVIAIDTNHEQNISLNSPMSCLTSATGRMSLNFKPSRQVGMADQITLAVDGLNETIKLQQTGFAGEEVRIDVTDRHGDLNFQIQCSTRDQFKKRAIPNQRKLVCRGYSDLKDSTYGREVINKSFSMTSSLTESDLFLAEGLTIRVIEFGSGDQARIEYNAEGLGRRNSVTSSAYLRTASTFKARNGRYSVDVTCRPEDSIMRAKAQ